MITKAIIPVAGWGTRMLPITKSIEKCMLPVGTRPVIDYIVQDVVRAGVKDIYFVVGEQSTQVQSYYRSNIQLNDYLRRAGKEDKLPLVAPLRDVRIHFLTQPGESDFVIMGDQFFWRGDSGSNAADLAELVKSRGLSAGLLGNPVEEEFIPQTGIIETDDQGNFVRIIEKPKLEEAPSNLSNSSFYVLNKEIFELARTLPANPKRGEFELTDAINAYIDGGGVIAVGEAKGEYMECGSPSGWLKANNAMAKNATC